MQSPLAVAWNEGTLPSLGGERLSHQGRYDGYASSLEKPMKYLMTMIHAATGLIAGILLGTWLFMLCFGPFGFLFPVSESLDPTMLARLEALPGKPLALAMLGVGLLLARWVWRQAPVWRWLVVIATLVPGIPSVGWIVFVFAMGPAVSNFGYGG